MKNKKGTRPPETAIRFSFKESPYAIMQLVDEYLRKFGLELVDYNMPGEIFYFDIIKKEKI